MNFPYSPLDIERIRTDFPILSREVRPGVPLIYLDSAASSQKPQQTMQKRVSSCPPGTEQENAEEHYTRHQADNLSPPVFLLPRGKRSRKSKQYYR